MLKKLIARVATWWNTSNLAIVDFPERTVVYAKDQPEYRPLPAYRYYKDPQGRVVCCWQFGWKDRIRLLLFGRVWHTILTFGGALQPQLLEVSKPAMPPPDIFD